MKNSNQIIKFNISKIKSHSLNLFIILSSIICSSLVNAAEIIQLKDDKILIKGEEDEFSVNQVVLIKDPDSFKETGSAVIRKIKSDENSYIGEILKGNAKEYDLIVASKKKSQRALAQSESEDDKSNNPNDVLFDSESESSFAKRNKRKNKSGYDSKKIMYGVGGGLFISSLNIKTSIVQSNMTGTGLGVNVLLKIPFTSQINGIGGVGIHPLVVSGSNSVGTTSKVNINYYGFGGLLRYMFSRKSLGGWAGMGGHFLIPASKSSNILSDESISTNYTINFGAGYDLLLNKRNVLILKFEYGILPSTSTSTTNSSGSQMIISAGYLFK